MISIREHWFPIVLYQSNTPGEYKDGLVCERLKIYLWNKTISVNKYVNKNVNK